MNVEYTITNDIDRSIPTPSRSLRSVGRVACQPDRLGVGLLNNNEDRSILAPSPCGEGWGGAL